MNDSLYNAYIRWLYRERGSWSSWDGPMCSFDYYRTYVAVQR